MTYCAADADCRRDGEAGRIPPRAGPAWPPSRPLFCPPTSQTRRSYGIHLNYGCCTPVLGILKGLILIGLICWLFPGNPKPAKDLAPSEPMGRDENSSRLLAVVLTMWVTESWHGVAQRGQGWRPRSSLCCRV